MIFASLQARLRRLRATGRRTVAVPAALAAALALLMLPAAANAATGGARIYWSSYGEEQSGTPSAGKIQFGALGGEASYQTLFTVPTEEQKGKVLSPEVEGIALDPAAGKIYWVAGAHNQIMEANLDGQGAPQALYTGTVGYIEGLTVDAANGKLYWVDDSSGEIIAANLSGQGALQTLYTEPSGSEPIGIAVDPAAGKLYWTDYATNEIRVGGVGGEVEAKTLYREPSGSSPAGIAADPASGRLYWSDEGTGQIRVGGLGGESEVKEAKTLYTDPAGSGAWGIAIDPAIGRLYWADYKTGEIRMGAVGGETELAGSTLYTETPNVEPAYPAVLSAPAGTGAPTVSGTPAIGSSLSCSQGTWAADMPEASFYQAPQSFSYQWTRDGVAIAGATSASLTPNEGGSYACDVSAANAAGSTAQGSAAAVVPAPAPVAAITAPASGGTYTVEPKPAPIVKIASSKAIVKGGHARVKLACKGGAECTGEVVLKARVRLTVKHGRHHRARMVTIVLGRASFTIHAGAHAVVSVKLSSFAKKALAQASHHRLKAKTIATVRGGKNAHRTVKLLEKAGRHAHRRRKRGHKHAP